MGNVRLGKQKADIALLMICTASRATGRNALNVLEATFMIKRSKNVLPSIQYAKVITSRMENA